MELTTVAQATTARSAAGRRHNSGMNSSSDSNVYSGYSGSSVGYSGYSGSSVGYSRHSGDAVRAMAGRGFSSGWPDRWQGTAGADRWSERPFQSAPRPVDSHPLSVDTDDVTSKPTRLRCAAGEHRATPERCLGLGEFRRGGRVSVIARWPGWRRMEL